jgi:hypothetical protein
MRKSESWRYSTNQFDNSTKNSKKRMKIISTDHDGKLMERQGEPGIGDLYAFYHPLHEGYINKYSDWMVMRASYKGSSLVIRNLFGELSSSRIRTWDVTIQGFYPLNTQRYVELLPNRRKPFQNGGYEQRSAAVQALVQAIGTDDNLHTLKEDVIAFRTSVDDARNAQQGKEGMVDELSLQLEARRIACAEALFRNLGDLMHIYYQDPSHIAAFFDLDNLRRTSREEEEPEVPTVYTLPCLQYVNAEVTFNDDTRLGFYNSGQVPVTIFTGGETPEVPADAFVLQQGAQAVKRASDLGAAGSTILWFRNNNPDFEGEIELVLEQ